MAKLADLLRTGTTVPAEVVSMQIWSRIEDRKHEQPDPSEDARAQRYIKAHTPHERPEDAFRAGMTERPSRKRVSAKCTRCTSRYTGIVRRGYDVIVCRKEAWV